tara:strand:+ start:384 stop:1091 length:708 start_codon:yes stop_codon:yes gene_type:complete
MAINELSLVIPAHNSSKVIEKSIKNFYDFLSPKINNLEIIVVCNDCWDNTKELCQELAHKYPVKVIEIPQRGKGYALIKGFDNAKYNSLGFLDADNPFDLSKILKMIEIVENSEKADIAIATKYLKRQAKLQDSQIRRFLSLGAHFTSRILFNMNFRDTQAGAKFFKKEVWQKVKKDFICKGFDFDIEFLYKAKKQKFKIAEIYIPIEYEKFSTFRLKYLPGMLKRLFKLRFKLI